MSWPLLFISEQDFTNHVRETIKKYGDKLKPFDLNRLNQNIIDPIKLIFDKAVYRSTWESVIGNEIFRQRDKSNNNDIGYFHQRIFQYMKNCHVPKNGEEGGWDVIYKEQNGIHLPDNQIVHTVYVEMKNKHNTMNSSSSSKTFIKMQNQILQDDDCACFLVEAIAKRSQNIKWSIKLNEKTVSHKLIRRVSLDQFYALVTSQEDAFYQMCRILPQTILRVLETEKNEETLAPQDSAFKELIDIANKSQIKNHDLAVAMAIYLLGFPTYKGFEKEAQKVLR